MVLSALHFHSNIITSWSFLTYTPQSNQNLVFYTKSVPKNIKNDPWILVLVSKSTELYTCMWQYTYKNRLHWWEQFNYDIAKVTYWDLIVKKQLLCQVHNFEVKSNWGFIRGTRPKMGTQKCDGMIFTATNCHFLQMLITYRILSITDNYLIHITNKAPIGALNFC